MNHASALFLAIAALIIGSATSPGPGDAQCGLLNKLGGMAAAESNRPGVLSVLEQIAQGRSQDISADLENRLGITPSEFRHPAYGDVGVRALYEVLDEPGLRRPSIS
jgi:hypothetical protein